MEHASIESLSGKSNEIVVIVEDLVQRAHEVIESFKALTFKHEATPLTAFVGTAAAIGGLQAGEALMATVAPDAMLLIGSSAALATLLFAAPAAPLGTPWHSFLGHTVCMGVALSVQWLQALTNLSLLAKVLVPSLSISLMARYKVVNRPAQMASTAFLRPPSPALTGSPLLSPSLAFPTRSSTRPPPPAPTSSSPTSKPRPSQPKAPSFSSCQPSSHARGSCFASSCWRAAWRGSRRAAVAACHSRPRALRPSHSLP